VSAKDRGTGKEQSMTITGGSALSKDEIDKMVRDAEQYAEEDRQRREAVEARNQADSMVYSTEQFLTENADKLPEDVRTEVQTDIDELKKVLGDESSTSEAITAAVGKLNTSSQKMGAAMYAQAEASGAEQSGDASSAESGDASQGSEDVFEGEVVDEDEGEAK
jgi:molecular chaperone DnaK